MGTSLGFDLDFKDKRFLQDKFIASLDLPTYYNFSKYQFLDVLDALSFRVMILDHLKQEAEDQKKKEDLEKAQNDDENKIDNPTGAGGNPSAVKTENPGGGGP